MKGQIVVSEVILTIALTAITVVALLQIPKMIEDLADLLSLSSSETVAEDLAGLITISAAAPDSITLSYKSAREDLLYTLTVEKRVVTVESPFKAPRFVELPGRAKVGVDPTGSFEDVKQFTIKKLVEAGENKYTLEAK